MVERSLGKLDKMKAYSGTFASYSINELSNKAKENAHAKWLSGCDEFLSGSEIEETLNAFCKAFNVTLKEWSYGGNCNPSYNFVLNIDEEQEELSGIRLATFVWNNFAQYVQKGKFYSLWSKTEKEEHNPNMRKLKQRYSKIQKEFNCPFTGMCYDDDILKNIIECIDYETLYDSYEDLIDSCLDYYFNMAQKEYEYTQSEEYFIEDSVGNDCEYDINGNAFYLPSGFKKVA